MGEGQIKGKSATAVAKDVVDGYLYLNPSFLKKLEDEGFKTLHLELKKVEIGVRSESFPTHDLEGIRRRNLKLQRIHQAMVILKHAAKGKKIILA